MALALFILEIINYHSQQKLRTIPTNRDANALEVEKIAKAWRT